MRNSRVSLGRAMKDLKKKKFGQTRNNPNFTDTYMDLFYFECPNPRLFKAIIDKVNQHNQKAWVAKKPLLLMFYEKLMQQVAAAVTIQLNFRAYLSRQRE